MSGFYFGLIKQCLNPRRFVDEEQRQISSMLEISEYRREEYAEAACASPLVRTTKNGWSILAIFSVKA